MLTSHELPNQLLKLNEELNDFDFVLSHLYSKNCDYKYYYKYLKISNPNRLCILDNSAYELSVSGEAFNETEFLENIIDLNPDYYLVPDILMDKNETINRSINFISKYGNYIKEKTSSKPLFVPQGRSFKEFLECLDFFVVNLLDKNDNLVAIPFHNDFFLDFGRVNFGLNNIDDQYAMGRVVVMKYLNENYNLKYHLLGCHSVCEITYQSLINNIISIDTGLPVKKGIIGQGIYDDGKPDIIIDDFIDKEILESEKRLIISNINKFKLDAECISL